MSLKQRLVSICLKRLTELDLGKDEKYLKRLKEELIEIDSQDEYQYFLSLYDKKARWKKNEHNTIVPFLLGLCKEFDINSPSASVMGEYPDIDCDYLSDVRDYLRLEWAPKVFGADCVSYIGTYNTYALKQALTDMARVFGKDRNEALAITKQFGNKDEEGESLTWDKALEIYPDFKAYCEKYPDVADAAKHLVGRLKSKGKHAGGFIVSDRPLNSFVPMMRDESGVISTAWTEGQTFQDLQPVGLIKFDLLSSKMWQQIVDTVGIIKQRYPDMDAICATPGGPHWSDESYLNDPKALKMADRGDLRFVFQFDSPGIRSLVKTGGVSSFNDLVAYSALYRPGPMGEKMHEEYCKRKKGEIQYEIHPRLKQALDDTYGVLCLHSKTFVSRANGECEQIRKTRKGQILHSLNEKTGEIEAQECRGCGPTKIARGLRIRLANGTWVVCTPDHEILTIDGWKPARDLRHNVDLVAVPKKTPVLGQAKDFPDHKWICEDRTDLAWFFGLLIHSGRIKGKKAIHLKSGLNEHSINIFRYISRKLPRLKMKVRRKAQAIDIYYDLKPPRKDKSHTNLDQLFEDFDLWRCIRYRIVPTTIMSADVETRAAFLAGVMDMGCAFSKRHKFESVCKFHTSFRNLIQGVRQMFQNEGVWTYAGRKANLTVLDWCPLLDRMAKYCRIREPKKIDLLKTHQQKERGVLPAKLYFEKLNQYKHRLGRNRLMRYDKDWYSVNGLAKAGVPLDNVRFVPVIHTRSMNHAVFYGISVANNHNLVANGIIVKNCYQEDVMRVLNIAGNIPLRDGYGLIKAISKKKLDKFAKYKDAFIKHCQHNLGYEEEQAVKFWDQIEAFAGYGFNRSHSCAYTIVSGRQLYLKANYPLEYFTAMFNHINGNDKDVKLRDCIRAAVQCKVKVKPADIMHSDVHFAIHSPDGKPSSEDVVYYGLSHLKSVGTEIAAKVVDLRKERPFTGFEDFLERVGPDKKLIEMVLTLRMFDEADLETLYKFYLVYRDYIKKKMAREKTHERRVEKYRGLLEEVSGRKIEGTITEEVVDSLEPRSTDRPIVNKFNLVCGNFKRMLYNEMVYLRQHKPTLSNFKCTEKHVVPEKIRAMFNDLTLAELQYYGFTWKGPMDDCEDVMGYTVEYFNSLGYAPDAVGPIEGVVGKTFEQTSKKNADFKYFKVSMKDANWEDFSIQLWRDEYERFKDRFVEGNIIRAQVFPPNPKFGDRRFLIESYPPWQKRKFPPPQADYRVVVLKCN